MASIRQFAKRHLLWGGFLAVLLPLGILLPLQYKWLTSLERTSAIAETAWLENYAEAVASEVEYFYRTQAERALNIPGDLFQYPAKKLSRYLAKKDVRGAKSLFVARYTGKDWGELVIVDPERGGYAMPDDPSVVRAIHVALSPWKVLANKGAPLQSHAMGVDEKDPENRIILNPISDDSCRVIGVAGMVIDGDYVEEELLPAAVEKSLPKFFNKRAMQNLVINVRDGKERVVFGREHGTDHEDEVSKHLSFVFTDWTISLGSRYATPEQWAKSNFLLNISLSVLLTVALLGGVILTLRTASRQIRLSRMKSDFVSNVSHELRTPLASIRVFAEFFRLGRVRNEEKSREYGEYIETESRRLTQLINNILDFSKIESGAKTYELEPSDLKTVVEDVLRTMEVSLKHRGFRLRFEPTNASLPPLLLDPDAIGQALANLVDNAVKYSNGSKEISVRLALDGDQAVLAVRDQGIGISRDEQQKIFERFHRVSTGLVHDVKGSGLGLSIVNHVVQAHGGTVSVESEVGSGSTFTIRLPLSVEHAVAAEEPPLRTAAGNS